LIRGGGAGGGVRLETPSEHHGVVGALVETLGAYSRESATPTDAPRRGRAPEELDVHEAGEHRGLDAVSI